MNNRVLHGVPVAVRTDSSPAPLNPIQGGPAVGHLPVRRAQSHQAPHPRVFVLPFLEGELAYAPTDPLVQLLESVAAGGGPVVPYPSLHELLQLFKHLSDRDSAVPLGDSANGLLELHNGLEMRGQSRSGRGSRKLEPEEFQGLRRTDFRLLPVEPELQVHHRRGFQDCEHRIYQFDGGEGIRIRLEMPGNLR